MSGVGEGWREAENAGISAGLARGSNYRVQLCIRPV